MAGMSTGRTNHTSADKQQLCPPAATSVGPKAAATMPFSASLLTTAGQPTTAGKCGAPSPFYLKRNPHDSTLIMDYMLIMSINQ